MKQLFFIIILFQTGCMFGQKPYLGSYLGHRRFSSALTISFNGDSLFYAKSSGCKSWNKGYGKFTITKKQLSLIFTDSIIPYTISKTTCGHADSVTLQITVKDRETHVPLAAGVWCSKGKNGFRPRTTDENGKLVVKLKKSSHEFIMNIDYGGMYNPISLPIHMKECTDLTVYLEQKFMIHSGRGTVWTYKIIRHHGKRLILKDEFGKWKLKKIKDHLDRT